jgi:tRNA(fMet)-specific endonuclease VapC
MILVLDTDHLTVIQRQMEPAYSHLRARLDTFSPDDVYTTIVNVEEQMRGWLSLIAGAKKPAEEVYAYQRLYLMLGFFSEIPLLNYERDAAALFRRLRHSHPRMGAMDLKIAAITMAQSGLLLSRNLKDFHPGSGLLVEDWTKPWH